MNRIRNTVEDRIIFEGDDSTFVEFVQQIVIENGDYQFSILGCSDAEEYIELCCDDLEVVEDE